MSTPDGSSSFTATVTGPHGISEPVNQYESVLLIASGSGIATVIPYLRKLIHSYNQTSTYRTRQVHLVWQVQTLGEQAPRVLFHLLIEVDMAVAAESSMNSLLKDDTLADGYVSNSLARWLHSAD